MKANVDIASLLCETSLGLSENLEVSASRDIGIAVYFYKSYRFRLSEMQAVS